MPSRVIGGVHSNFPLFATFGAIVSRTCKSPGTPLISTMLTVPGFAEATHSIGNGVPAVQTSPAAGLVITFSLFSAPWALTKGAAIAANESSEEKIENRIVDFFFLLSFLYFFILGF